jgi:hypothetical protein
VSGAADAIFKNPTVVELAAQFRTVLNSVNHG